MTIWHRNKIIQKYEIDPEEYLNVYVVEQGDLNFVPPNFENTTLEAGNSYGGLQKAIETASHYENKSRNIRILVGEGIYEEDLNFSNLDLSHILIQGTSLSGLNDFDDWVQTKAANATRPTKEEITNEYKTYIKGQVKFYECDLPSIRNIVLDGSTTLGAHEFRNCVQSIMSKLDLICLDNYALENGVDKWSATLFFDRSFLYITVFWITSGFLFQRFWGKRHNSEKHSSL